MNYYLISTTMAAAAILIQTSNVVPSTAFITMRAPIRTRTIRPSRLKPLFYADKDDTSSEKISREHYSVSSLFRNVEDDHVHAAPPTPVPVLPTLPVLPGDCDVQAYINENINFSIFSNYLFSS